jgi:hypothetical protein
VKAGAINNILWPKLEFYMIIAAAILAVALVIAVIDKLFKMCGIHLKPLKSIQNVFGFNLLI